jgi:hypothetical protein
MRPPRQSLCREVRQTLLLRRKHGQTLRVTTLPEVASGHLNTHCFVKLRLVMSSVTDGVKIIDFAAFWLNSAFNIMHGILC